MDSFELSAELEEEIISFAFGCVVDDNRFVNHFNSDLNPLIYYSKILFRNYRKRLIIQLKTFFETMIGSSDPKNDSKCQWIEQKFEFSVNYSQIKTIDVKDNQMVIKLLFPPLLNAIVDENDFFYPNDVSENMSDEINKSDSGIEDMSSDEFEYCFVGKDISDTIQSNRNFDFCGLRLRTTKLLDQIEDKFTKINSIGIQFKDNNSLTDIVSNLKVFEPLITFGTKSFQTIECKPSDIDSDNLSDLSFAVRYSLEALTNHSFQLIDSLNYFGLNFNEFVQTIKDLSKIDEKCVENSLNDLRVKIENNIDIRPLDDLRHSFDEYRKEETEKWTNKSVVMVRRCILTPTRALLLPALPLQESRFLRTANPEYVIRVLIKDEDFQMMSFTTCKKSLPDEHPLMDQIYEFLFDKIVDRLSNGIQIGGRFYELIGASTSQLRDHGLVLYACDHLKRNAFMIRQQIGRIDCFRNSAKFIARIGQSMSQSMGCLQSIECIEMIDDIKGGVHPKTEKPYIFSDGVGMISQAMVNELCAGLKLNDVSAFQIRYAGFKGILVLNPELKGRKILLRPSMKKFESDSTELDVLKVSEPRSCYLNRPLITILNQMGVTNDTFLELLYKRHKQLANAFQCKCRAIKLMTNYSELDFSLKKLLNSGIDVLKEPFFVDIIESIITKVSLDLKNKARILIPFDSGRVMYGVLDETKTLNYGQVFVQYSDKGSGQKRILAEQILVTKYPCMNAGDVRKFEAIDVPELHHIFDCIVFPAKGERPHPDEMAGSDLDGDEYSVIWYKPLIFEKENYLPMDFPSGEAQDLGRSVTNKDILRFYCRFIASDQVGLIAHSHLVWADQVNFGIRSNLCEHLAYKYAVALDYAKTGINARLSGDQKPNLYPDFMMKSNEKPTYKSNNALGKLFQKNSYFYEVINRFTKENVGFDLNPNLIHERADIHMESARNMYRIYDNSVKELMVKFGIQSESSLVSSTFNKTHKYLCTHNDNSDTYDLVTNITKRLFADLLNQFESGVEEEEWLLAKASAWYQVSHQINDRRSGFPWIVSKYLVKLSQKNGSKRHDCNHSSEIIIDCHKSFTKQTVLNVFNQFMHFLRNTSGTTSLLGQSFDKMIEKVFQRHDSKHNEFSLNILTELFSELSNDEHLKDFDKEYDVAITALLANMKIRRIGLMKAIEYEKEINLEKEMSYKTFVLVVAVSQKVTIIFKNDPNIGHPIDSLISRIKLKTGVSQLVIKYGSEGHESNICVYGTQRSVKKFEQFITHKYIDSNLKNQDFDLTFN